jgi:hypothetical protein
VIVSDSLRISAQAAKPSLPFDQTRERRGRRLDVDAFVPQNLANRFLGVGIFDLASPDLCQVFAGPAPWVHPTALEFAISGVTFSPCVNSIVTVGVLAGGHTGLRMPPLKAPNAADFLSGGMGRSLGAAGEVNPLRQTCRG